MTSQLRNSINRLSKKLVGLALLVTAMLLAFIMVVTGPKAEPLEKTERAWPVSVIIANPSSLPPTLLTFGRVESEQIANLSITISAPVTAVLVREGSWVEEGELLIQLNAQESELALAVAQANHQRDKAQLASVKTEFELANNLTDNYQQLAQIGEVSLQRALDLHSRNMISDAQMDAAKQAASQSSMARRQHLSQVSNFPNRLALQEAAVAESYAQAQQAQLDLQQTEIRAPFNGRVISTNVARGDRINAGTTLIKIADSSGLEIRASVPTDVGFLLSQSLGDNKKVHATANVNGKKLEFQLDRLSADVKRGQSGIDGFFRSEKSESWDLLDIGRVVNLSVNLPKQDNVISMPVHALYENQTVFRILEQRLQAIHYETVGDYISQDDEFRVLIRSPQLEPGDHLLGSQLSRAITGLLVEPIVGDR